MSFIEKIAIIVYGLLFAITSIAMESSVSSSSSSSSSTSSTSNPAPRFLRAILILERGIDENAYCGSEAMLREFAANLVEHASPIIVNAPTIHHLIYETENKSEKIKSEIETINKEISELEKDIANTDKEILDLDKDLSDTKQKISKLREEKVEKKEELLPKKETELLLQKGQTSTLNLRYSLLTSQIARRDILRMKYEEQSDALRKTISVVTLKKSDWSIYKQVGSSLYLLVPRSFIDDKNKIWNSYFDQNNAQAHALCKHLGISQQELILGFKVDHPDIMQKISFDALAAELKQMYESNLAKTLATHKVAQLLPSRWNQEINPESIKKMFVSSEKTSSPLLGIWNIFISGHGGSSSEQHVTLFPLSEHDPRAAIAGLSIDDFNKLITFFCKHLDTASIFYSTCFGGGHHRKVIQHTIDQSIHKKNRPIVINNGITDISISPQTRLFSDYFNEMEQVLGPIIRNSDSETTFNTLIEQNEKGIAAATKNLSSGSQQATTIPSLYVKGWKAWKLLDPDGIIMTIDSAKGSSHNPIIVDTQIRGILLTTHHIIAPLTITSVVSCDSLFYPIFISDLPRKSEHIFNEVHIETQCNLNDFIKLSLLRLKYAYEKKFIFKKITGLKQPNGTEPVEIHNLEVSTNGSMRYTVGTTTYACKNETCSGDECALQPEKEFDWKIMDTKPKRENEKEKLKM